MDYAVTILGSGTCVCDPAHYPASFLVEVESLSEKWLVDLGSGCLQRLVAMGVSPFSIDRIFLTHAHPDHIASYLPYFQALTFTPGQVRTTPVAFYYSAEVEGICGILRTLNGCIDSGFPFTINLLASGERVKLGREVSVLSLEMAHSAPTLGFRFEIGERILAFGADSGVCDNLVLLCKDADVAIFDCSLAAGCGTPSHAATNEVGKMAREAKAIKIVLTHMYPNLLAMGFREVVRQVSSGGYAGEIIFGEDGLRIQV